MPELDDKIHNARMCKQWHKFEAFARELLAQQPNSVYAIQLIGESLEKQGQVENALVYYEKALEIDREEKQEIGGHTFFLKRLDILYHRAGKYEDCLRISEYYTDRHPENWDAWNRLRRAAKKTGNAEISSYAKKRADEIRNRQGAAKKKATKAIGEPRPNAWSKSVVKAQDIGKLLERQVKEKPLPPLKDDDPFWDVDEAYLDELRSRVEAGLREDEG